MREENHVFARWRNIMHVAFDKRRFSGGCISHHNHLGCVCQFWGSHFPRLAKMKRSSSDASLPSTTARSAKRNYNDFSAAPEDISMQPLGLEQSDCPSNSYSGAAPSTSTRLPADSSLGKLTKEVSCSDFALLRFEITELSSWISYKKPLMGFWTETKQQHCFKFKNEGYMTLRMVCSEFSFHFSNCLSSLSTRGCRPHRKTI